MNRHNEPTQSIGWAQKTTPPRLVSPGGANCLRTMGLGRLELPTHALQAKGGKLQLRGFPSRLCLRLSRRIAASRLRFLCALGFS